MEQATGRRRGGARRLAQGPEYERSVSVPSVMRILRDQHMPPEEIHVLSTTTDPALVHRYLELHRERLEEWLADQRRTLATIERVLVTSQAELAEEGETRWTCGYSASTNPTRKGDSRRARSRS
jgi:hypothetical protein